MFAAPAPSSESELPVAGRVIWMTPIYRGPPNWGLEALVASGGVALLFAARQTLRLRDF